MKKLDYLESSLCETSDNSKGKARLLVSLEWVYRWRYATPDIIKQLLGIKNNHHYKLISNWEATGFIRKIKTAHLRFRNLIILTQRGVEFLQAYSGTIITSPLTDKTKISISGIQHCLATQSFALSMIGSKTSFESEHELRLKQCPGEKVPDFLMIDHNNSTIAVEVELSSKSPEQTEIAFSHALTGLTNKKFDQLVYASSSKAILRKYEKLSKKNRIGIWERNQKTKKWIETSDSFLIPSNFKNNIAFRFDLVNYFKMFIG